MKAGKENPYKQVKKRDPKGYKPKRFGCLCYSRKQPKALLKSTELRGEP